MKKLIFVILISLLSYISIQPNHTFAKTKEDTQIYTIKAEDTSLKIALQFAVSEKELKKINLTNKNELEAGERIIIPETISNKELDLLARLVHAEAKGEPFEGKVAVASVVLNRVDHNQFPNSIEKVIKQDGQFQPVDNGAIKEPAGKVDMKAVKTALALEDQGDGSLFFYNPEIAENHWQKTQTVTKKIGNHHFSK
jgi:N-acetylmuramoyl-L-alanine amidase